MDKVESAVKLERDWSTSSSQRRTAVTPPSSPSLSKKMRMMSSTKTDDKDVKFSTPDSNNTLNSSTIKIIGQNAKFASKMGLGKMGLGHGQPVNIADTGIVEEDDCLKLDLTCLIPNCVQMTSAELVAASNALPTNDGNISTSVYREERTKGGMGCPLPPEKPSTPLNPKELMPPTPTVYINSSEEAFSPHLLDFCLKHPIILIRNIAPACNLDLQLYTTKTLVEMNPNHPVSVWPSLN